MEDGVVSIFRVEVSVVSVLSVYMWRWQGEWSFRSMEGRKEAEHRRQQSEHYLRENLIN
jgi:hypothetical protein